MAEGLKTFNEGEDILAKEINANYQFLLSTLSGNAERVESYVKDEVATIKSNVASVQATLQKNIDNLNEKFNNFSENIYNNIAPDLSSGVAKTRGTTYTAEKAGWLFAFCHNNTNESTIKINDVSFTLSKSTKSETASGAGNFFYICKGDTYLLTGGIDSNKYYRLVFYPCKGQ
jgi:hypothetical protein